MMAAGWKGRALQTKTILIERFMRGSEGRMIFLMPTLGSRQILANCSDPRRNPMKLQAFLAVFIVLALGNLCVTTSEVSYASPSRVSFSLRAFDGGGDELGTIIIFINPPGKGFSEGRGWEWKGADTNTGGTYRWSHNGSSFILELLFEDGARFGTLTSPEWDMPNNPKREPPRPWFSSQGANAGLGSIAQGTPTKLIAGFNWQLRSAK